jgi:very-short-patch-repair endonuclease
MLCFCSDSAIKRAVVGRTLVRIARGTYALPELPDVLTVAAATRGLVSHQTAAQLHQLEMVFPPTAIHVTVRRGARPVLPDGVVAHQRQLPAGDLTRSKTSVLRTVFDCCATMSFREALAVADSAARRSPQFVGAFRQAAKAHGPGRVRRMQVARFATAEAANPFESALRGDLIEAGMTDLVPQFMVAVGRTTYRVDLADPVRRIAIEADSFAWHGSREALAADCRRYDELIRAGWLVLRFAWEQVMFDNEWVVGVVREVRALR